MKIKSAYVLQQTTAMSHRLHLHESVTHHLASEQKHLVFFMLANVSLDLLFLPQHVAIYRLPSVVPTH